MSQKRKFFHITGLIATLSILWLFLSGHYTPLLLSLGALSVLLVVSITLRMDMIKYEQPEVLQQSIMGIPYCLWLLKEILKANIDVCKRILNPKLPISPQIVWIKSSQRHELARTVYANSITLTPSTISIYVVHDQIEIHALSKEGSLRLENGEMDQRITKVEQKHV